MVKQTLAQRGGLLVQMGASKHVGTLAALVVSGLVLFFHLRILITDRLTFDEAFNLQVPLNLLLSGKYQTWYGEPRPFNHQITTGPTVLLPVAAVFLAFGPNPIPARLVTTSFLVLFLWLCWLLSERLLPRWRHTLFVSGCMFLLLLPNVIWISAQVLGELPAVTLFLAGALVMSQQLDGKRAWRILGGGALVGMAVLTKLVAALFVPPLFLALILSVLPRGRKRIVMICICALGVLLPVLAWEGIKLSVLGAEAYLVLLERTWRFFVFGGSGVNLQALTVPAKGVWPHITLLADTFQRNPTLLASGLGLMLLCCGMVFLKAGFLGRCLLGATLLYWAWWVFLSSWLNYRHLTPGLLLYALAVPYAVLYVASSYRTLLRRACLIPAVAGLLLATPLPSVPQVASNFTWHDQKRIAHTLIDILREHPDASVYGFGWSQVPALSFFAQMPFGNITKPRRDSGDRLYLVLEAVSIPEAWKYAKNFCAKWLVREHAASICRLRPGSPPGREVFPPP